MQRRELERALAAVPRHPAPRPGLEQYRTPDAVAAELLWAACRDGAIADRRVLDLGCGTGILAIGAALLGAGEVLGVDVDGEAVDAARAAARTAGVAGRVAFESRDLAAWHPPRFDTVVMNPPFGARAENRHADRLFLRRAAEAVKPTGPRPAGDGRDGPTAWFLAQVRTERFLAAYAGGLGGRLERVAAWDYPLQAQFGFHEEEARLVRVGGYRLSFPWPAPGQPS